MAGVFSIPKLTLRAENLNPGLPTFKWTDFSRNDKLGSGSFGAIYSGKYKGEEVVVKKLRLVDRESKRLFIKEARLLHEVKGNENIACFFAFCVEPYAIMMEYLCFYFRPFGVEKIVTSLSDFLQFIDGQLDFSSLKKFQTPIARDIANGLTYLHENNIVHRDLKPANVLVTNQHYALRWCEMEENARMKVFSEDPVKCKLTDFGESRATFLQTQTLLESQTHRVNRGTPAYMAPETHLNTTSSAVSHDDLKKADIWSFGMTMYSLLRLTLN